MEVKLRFLLVSLLRPEGMTWLLHHHPAKQKKAPGFPEAWRFYKDGSYHSSKALASSFILSCTYMVFKTALTSGEGWASYACFT